jgi:hypothetical protein
VSLSRRTFCFQSASTLGALAWGLGAHAKDDDKDNKGKAKGKNKTGGYKLEVRGFFNGGGIATVTGSTIAITANVLDEAGRRTPIEFPPTKLVKDRFTGQGTAGNQKITISGRIDPPAGAVKVARVTATYATASKRYGRISGELK